jgi:uncharacterized protein
MKVKLTDSAQVNPKNTLFSHSANASSHPAAFSSALKDTEIQRRTEACDNILKQIDVLGEQLKKGPTPEDVRKYRSLITEFVKEASDQSYDLHQESHWDHDGNRKNFVVIRQINQSVEELLDAVMNQEKKQIDIVARLTEIRGLLLDLYL